MLFVIKVTVLFLICITCAAYLSLFERKVIARIQMRLGPSYNGFFGILQPISDALKLFFKRNALKNVPKRAVVAVSILMMTSLISMTIIPFSPTLYIFNSNYSLIYILIFHAIIRFAEIIIGVESGSKYGLIGGVRGYFQIIAEFFPYLLSILCISVITASFNLVEIVEFQGNTPFAPIMIPIFVIFFIVTIIGLNRTPFDFTEAESEIVAGSYVEYGGMLFAMIYLSEYINLMFSSCVIVLLFLGGWGSFCGISFITPLISMILKILLVMTTIIVVRSILPRYKQKQAIHICLSIFCPIIIFYIISFGPVLNKAFD